MATPSSQVGPQPLSSKETKDKLAAFDSVPLFMKSLPSENTDDTVVAALQSLVHQGTPDEVAQNFKEQGNEYFKGKRYREALGFYTQGVDAKPTNVVLEEGLLCNRAACNLELKNYGSVLRDCSKALKLNSQSSKAFYRSGLALMALDRLEEALDCCDRCLSFDAHNQGVQTIRHQAVTAKMAKDRKEREKAVRLRKEEEARRQMSIAFKERNLIAIPAKDGSSNPYAPHFDSEDPTQNTLIIPVFFLYPQYATSDVIPEFVETTQFSAHVAAMFPPQVPPPEWDSKGEYVYGQLVIYAITHRKRLLKVGKKMSLRDVCNAAKGREGEPIDGLDVKDGCLAFVILPKGNVERKWVEEYKQTRGG